VYVREGRTWILWGYGFVTSFVLMFDMFILPRIVPGIFNEKKWNVFKGILFQFWHIISIGTANILYAIFMGGKTLGLPEVAGFFLTTFSIGFFPITLSVVSIQLYLLKKYADSSGEINESIAASENRRKEVTEKLHNIFITSESGKEEIEIDLKDLLFIRSVDNYVEIYRKERDLVEIVLLRGSLKRIEEDLKAYPYLFRCHRTYLVNVNNISGVKGNSQGYKLIYEGVESIIPVSRNSSKRLLDLLD